MFVCSCGFSSYFRIFHSYGDITIAGAGASNFDQCSTLMAIEQWGFFSVPHLLWHGTSVYNGHLREHVNLTPLAQRLAVKLSLHETTKTTRMILRILPFMVDNFSLAKFLIINILSIVLNKWSMSWRQYCITKISYEINAGAILSIACSVEGPSAPCLIQYTVWGVFLCHVVYLIC